jgi:hypothetical protein
MDVSSAVRNLREDALERNFEVLWLAERPELSGASLYHSETAMIASISVSLEISIPLL